MVDIVMLWILLLKRLNDVSGINIVRYNADMTIIRILFVTAAKIHIHQRQSDYGNFQPPRNKFLFHFEKFRTNSLGVRRRSETGLRPANKRERVKKNAF